MRLEPAPYFTDITEGARTAEAVWATTSDGVRIRFGFWTGGTKGTILLFPGRTEYIEKYAYIATELAGNGYSVAVADWRGQGLADRLIDDPNKGHVAEFDDYQRDVAALLGAARAKGLPEPYFLLAHSMGGAIGLRALIEGLPVASAVFSAPMWGIWFSPVMRPLVGVVSWAANAFGLGKRYAPGSGPLNYAVEAEFKGNTLTNDPEMWAMMQSQANARPELCIGGPSLHWLQEALQATGALMRAPLPKIATLVLLGSKEKITDPAAIHQTARRWPSATLEMFEGAEHEILMELPHMREHAMALLLAHFSAHR